MLAQNDNKTGRKRSSIRTRRFKMARIITSQTGKGIDIVIRDSSQGGALLELATKAPMSQNFIMHIDSEDKFHHCQLRWRNDNKMGVEILA